jgi:hypothetical protein
MIWIMVVIHPMPLSKPLELFVDVRDLSFKNYL